MSKKIALCILMMAAGAVPFGAHAADGGVYFGAGGGMTLLDVDNTGFSQASFSYKGYVGYAFGQILGLEAAYFTSGNASQEYADGAGKLDIKFTGESAALVLRAPTASAISVFGRIGYAQYTRTVKSSGTGTPVIADGDTDGRGVNYGIGVSYLFTRRWYARLEGEGIKVNDGNFLQINLGVGVKF